MRSGTSRHPGLEEAVDLTSLRVNVHVQVTRSGRKTGNGLDVGGKGVT